ncbi:MAG: hypothetical protein HFH46_01340, partial [Bacilli bacterium]|nr:hypothetical protein [Bacilli bacterium]
NRTFFILTFALATTCLSGCGEILSEDKNDKENIEPIEIESSENEEWIKTGNKEVKKAYEHMIYEIVQFESTNPNDTWSKSAVYSYENGEIDIPEGYAYVSSETLTVHEGYGSTTFAIKYNYINVIDVEAEEYASSGQNEKAYPFAGTPIDLEKAQNMPKVLVR